MNDSLEVWWFLEGAMGGNKRMEGGIVDEVGGSCVGARCFCLHLMRASWLGLGIVHIA